MSGNYCRSVKIQRFPTIDTWIPGIGGAGGSDGDERIAMFCGNRQVDKEGDPFRASSDMNEANVVPELEKVVEKIISELPEGKRIFFISTGFLEDGSPEWQGSLDDYLKIFNSLDEPFLYMAHLRALPDEWFPSKYADRLCMVHLAFIRSGMFHVYVMEAPWWQDYAEVAAEYQRGKGAGKGASEKKRKGAKRS